MAPPPIALDDAHLGEAMARVRALAARRDAPKVLALLSETGLLDQLGPDDHEVGAAALHDASRRLIDGETEPVGLIATIVAKVRPPARITNNAILVDYLHAVIAAHEPLVSTPHRDAAWAVLSDIAARDLSAVPGVREHVLGFAAEVGLVEPLPADLDAALMRHVEHPYLFAEPRAYLNLLAYRLHRADREGSTGASWLLDWSHSVANAAFSRPRRARHRRSLLEMKDAVHDKARRFFSLSRVAFARDGGLRAALVLLLIRLDCLVWPRTRRRPHDIHYAWLWVLRIFLRLLGGRAARRRAPAAMRAPETGALTAIAPPTLSGTAADVLVTRAQGGLGDVLMMRPGLLALARTTAPGRVYFATHRDLFTVFSRDDPLTLVDIEATEIAWTSFGRWVNLTECPATRVEVQQLPHVTVNRIDIFAQALGVRLGPPSRARTRPRPLDETAEQRAEALLRDIAVPGRPTVGIQLRSAEPYRDAPQLLDIARALTARYTVIVFDNRPIPRAPDDAFIAISDQKLAVVLALIGQVDAVVTCDSLAVHVAGSHNVPCVALFGPTDGRVRTDHYPTVTVVDARESFDCMPCWRHQFSKCRISASYESVCMSRITLQQVETALAAALGQAAPCSGPKGHG